MSDDQRETGLVKSSDADRELILQQDSDANRSVLARLPGRSMFVAGVVGFLLLLAAQARGLPEGLRGPILSNSAVWGFGSVCLAVSGVYSMWFVAHRPVGWRPEVRGQRFQSVIVYTRNDCPLCDEAVLVLSRYRPWLPSVTEVDVDEFPELVEQYGEKVPVVEFDGTVRFHGTVNEVLLRRLIEGTQPLPQIRNR